MHDEQTQKILDYARNLGQQLHTSVRWVEDRGGYFEAEGGTSKVVAQAVAGLEFLRQYAGEDSYWTQRANQSFDSNGRGRSIASGAQEVGILLGQWVEQVEAGIREIVGAREREEFSVVSTDVMGQVRQLLEDRGTHPAAPIVLAGAALETALRTVVEGRGLQPEGKPSISAYARALKGADLLNKQDMKDIEACSGLRNDAAHGTFDNLTPARAGLMEQQTNLLLRRLAELQEPPDGASIGNRPEEDSA